MIDRERLISALHCRAQDLSIDLPPCDGCDYHDQLESISNGGCDIRRLCKDALDLLKEQPDIVRCKDCEYCKYPKSEKEWCKKGHLHGNAETWFCADGERRDAK